MLKSKGTTSHLCARCILPSSYPNIKFDNNGICNHCKSFEYHWGEWLASEALREKTAEKLQKTFKKAKEKKSKYDALVPFSGGKDSSYVLHLCKIKYGLNILAFTNDNGFLSDQAKSNIEKMTKKLGVTHIYYREPQMIKLARHFFVKTGNFCAPCELGMFNTNYMMAKKHRIPLIIYGSSSKTDAGFPKELNPWDPWYFKKVIKQSEAQKYIASTIFGKNYIIPYAVDFILGKRKFVLLPNYLIWNEKDIQNILKKEYNLIFTKEHSDCEFYEVAASLYRNRNPSLDSTVMKYSLLIRNGLMERDAVLSLIPNRFNDKKPESLDRFLKKLKLTISEFENSASLTPTPYLTGIPNLFIQIRKKIRKQY